MALRGVLFDLGGTLLNYDIHGWRGMEDTGAEAVYHFLVGRGYQLPPLQEALESSFDVIRGHWQQIGRGEPVNPQMRSILAEIMEIWGVPKIDLSDGLLDESLRTFTGAIQSYVTPMDGAKETLEALREQGLRIGLISNTAWPGETHMADLDRWELTPYLEVALFSADEGVWKPGPEIFRRALAALELKPDEAIFVGDNLYFDVFGPQQIGMKGVWIESQGWSPPLQPVHPDATLKRLPELLRVIESWREEGTTQA